VRTGRKGVHPDLQNTAATSALLSKKLVLPLPPVDDGIGALVWVSVKVIKPPLGSVDICCELVDEVEVVVGGIVEGVDELEGRLVEGIIVLDDVELLDEEEDELVEVEEVDMEDVELVEDLRRVWASRETDEINNRTHVEVVSGGTTRLVFVRVAAIIHKRMIPGVIYKELYRANGGRRAIQSPEP
jgi:hypothetical protein